MMIYAVWESESTKRSDADDEERDESELRMVMQAIIFQSSFSFFHASI